MTRVCWPVLAAALTLTFAAAAHASTVVGQLVTPNNSCDGQSVTVLQTNVASGSSYVVPTAGVITSWSVQDGAATIQDLKLKVGRFVSGNQYTIVGESAAGPQTPNTVSTFPARIPVSAGDIIGFFADGGDCAVVTGRSGDQVVVALGNQPLSSTGTFESGTGLIPLDAKIEPDADGDGFGDETQDQCPTNAATQGPCPPAPPAPPVTPPAHVSIDAAIAKVLKLSKGGSLTFTLTASQNTPGSATGTISIPKGAKVVRFKTAKFKLVPGKLTKVTLKLSKGALKSVRRAVKHRKLKVKITVTAGGTVKTLRTRLRH